MLFGYTARRERQVVYRSHVALAYILHLLLHRIQPLPLSIWRPARQCQPPRRLADDVMVACLSKADLRKAPPAPAKSSIVKRFYPRRTRVLLVNGLSILNDATASDGRFWRRYSKSRRNRERFEDWDARISRYADISHTLDPVLIDQSCKPVCSSGAPKIYPCPHTSTVSLLQSAIRCA